MSEEAKPIGFTSQRFTAIDLAREIGALNGHVLRASRTRISPGGGYASHAHNGRPEIIVMLKGTLTETRNGKTMHYKAGDVLEMYGNVVHTLENRDTTDIEYISITVRIP